MLDLELPGIKMRTKDGNTASYEISPVDAGFAVSLANAIRRTALGSLSGAAVTSLRIDGVAHELQDIPNVKEDVTDIVQNIKKLRLRSFSDHPVTIDIDVQGERTVTAADIKGPATIEIVNPELHIATLDNKNAHLEMELTVSTGRGWVSADVQADTRPDGHAIGVILTDAIFAPVRHVNFTIEHISVEQKLDKIVLALTTDGTISPDEALRQSAAILLQQFDIFANYWIKADVPEDHPVASDVPIPAFIYEMPIGDLGLPPRVYNSLKRAGMMKTGQILEMDEIDLKLLHNVGEKALQDLAAALKMKGLLP